MQRLHMHEIVLPLLGLLVLALPVNHILLDC